MNSLNIKKNSILIYVLLISVIFQSGTVQASLDSKSLLNLLMQGSMISILFYYTIIYLITNRFQVTKNIVIYFIVMEFIVVISAILYINSIFTLQYKMVLFLMFVLFINFVKQNSSLELEKILYNILFSLVFFTFVFYFIVGICSVDLPYEYTNFDSGEIVYKNYMYVFYTYSTSWPPRICGIFWEPGVFQIYINLCLYLYIFLQKSSKTEFTILILCSIFTQSTIGYLNTCIFIAVIIINNKYLNKKNKLILGAFVLLLTTIIICILLAHKIDTTSEVGDSYWLRLRDFYSGFSLFLQHPIVGIGFYNTSIFIQVSGHASGNSNGLLTLMYTMGIIGLFAVFYPFIINFLYAKGDRKILNFAFIIYVFLINVGEPIYSLSLMIFIVAREYATISFSSNFFKKLQA